MNDLKKLKWEKIFAWSLFFFFLLLQPILCIENIEIEKEDIRFKHLSVKDGLSQSFVYCILQDSKGFMWFGTQEGLHRYDGYDFKIYKYNPKNMDTISDSVIYCIHEDKEDKSEPGILWIGTRNGLNKFDPKTEIFTRYQHHPKNPKSLSHNEVRVIYEDHMGILWIGTRNGGLNQFDKKSELFKHYKYDEENPKSVSHNDVRAIGEDSKGILWVGTYGGGLNHFNREIDQFDHYTVDNNVLSSDKVMTIYKSRDGNIWVGTGGGGLYRFYGKNGKFEHYFHNENNPNSLGHNDVSAICEGQNEEMWIGTNGGGLDKLDRNTGNFTHYTADEFNPQSLSNNNIFSIYKDRSGILWLGNEIGGINVSNPNIKAFSPYTYKIEKPTNDVWAIFEDSTGVLWIGTIGGGLKKRESGSNEFKLYNPNKDIDLSDVRDIYEDRKKVLWFGTHGRGLIRFDRKTNEFKHYAIENSKIRSNNLRCIFEDHNDILWIGTAGDGLIKFDRDKDIFKRYQHNDNEKGSIGDDWIICIIEDKSNTLWIGTRGGGLNKFNREDETFTSYKHSDSTKSLSHNFVLSVYESSDNMLWIGTFSGGLNKMINRGKGIFEYYLERDGLPSSVVYGILEDNNGNIWLSTNKGLSKFNPKAKEDAFKNYDFDDGLQSNEFSQGAYFKNKKGKMFFGGINGFNSFFPEQIKDDPSKPSVVITYFLIFSKSVPQKRKKPHFPLEKTIQRTDELKLSYEQNSFSFEFASLHYANSPKNKYQYMLEGYKDEWILTDAKHRRATYTNLPSGNYVFHVKGSNNDGVWNEKGTSIKIEISPPAWKTWWAYSLYVLALIGLLYLIWSAWSKRFLKQRVEERTKELKNTQSQLVQSEKMASLGFLVAGVAHEINNPSSFTHTSAYNLEKDIEKLKALLIGLAGDDTDKEILDAFDEKFNVLFNHLASIKEGTSRISKTVSDLRTFSRMEKQEMKPIKLLEGLNITLNLVKTQYKDQVEFVTEFQSDPEVEGIAAELNQVFMNLLINACQAILEKQKRTGEEIMGTLTIQTLEKNEYALIRFEDTGAGMSKEVKQKMFDPFFTTRPVGEGTGLGLFISYGIIQKHKGRFEVVSEEDKGTTVTLYLPLKSKKSIKKELT